MDEKSELVQIKGLRDGLVATIAAADWHDQRAAVLAQIDARTSFFQGARLALDIGGQTLKVNELVEFRDRLSERGVALWAVISEDSTTTTTAQLLGLATRISKPRPEEDRQFDVEDLGEQTALFLNKTLRSGTRVEFAGHVIVLGDVNPGAEIVAEGSVLVWGRIRGVVSAGGKSNLEAVICGLDLAAASLRIGGVVAEAAEFHGHGGPAVARLVDDGAILVEAWHGT